jgi:pyruvoyl-dependent arginine decarboxylase
MNISACRFSLFTGKGDDRNYWTAEDSAWRNSGLGEINIFKIHGDLPAGATYCHVDKQQCPKGNHLICPAFYSIFTNNNTGTKISSVIGVGIPSHTHENGIVLTRAGICSLHELTIQIEASIVELFEKRRVCLSEIRLKGIEHTIGTCGSVLAACVLF